MHRFFLLILTAGIIAIGCNQQDGPEISEEMKLQLATTYYNNGLHEAAVAEYIDYLDAYQLDASRRSNTYYTIANIYFERLQDYKKALEFYFKVKYLYPDSPTIAEVNKRIVNCLERLQRSKDAARIYEREAALDPGSIQEHKSGAVLAEIGKKKITQGDLDFQLSRLPAVVQDQFDDKTKKKEFLKQIVMQELLYDSAKRQGLENDKDVIEGTFQAQKSLMAEKLLRAELQNKIKINPEDVELYYNANKERYAERDEEGKVVRQKPLQEVVQQVAQDLTMERQQKATSELLNRLMQAENVKLYDDRVQ